MLYRNGASLVVALELMLSSMAASVADEVEILFVLRGDASVSEEQLALTTENVEWFTNRPARDAGIIDVAKFQEVWMSGLGSPSPNAAVVGDTVNAIVELDSMAVTGMSIQFDVTVLRGTLPATDLGTVTLFVDPIGKISSTAGLGGN